MALKLVFQIPEFLLDLSIMQESVGKILGQPYFKYLDRCKNSSLSVKNNISLLFINSHFSHSASQRIGVHIQ